MIQNPPEEFLHYVWRTKNFDHHRLAIVGGESLEIISYGNYNTDAGPDFLNASIKIDNIVWAGHIEMHVFSSDWHKHKHSNDLAYDNVILHVVWDNDTVILNKSVQNIPSLVLSHRVATSLLSKYSALIRSQSWIPCENFIREVPEITKSSMLNRLIAERLTFKAENILSLNDENNGDFLETIYQVLSWSFGLTVNADSFLSLAKSLPYNMLSKHKDSLFQLEALLLGQSGLLENSTLDDPYIHELKKEYRFLQSKFSLVPMKAVAWKFMRMRPSGFPTVRIAQLALFIHQNIRLDAFFKESAENSIFSALDLVPGGFWSNHYTLNDVSIVREKPLGGDKKNSIIINAIAPLLFAFGIYKGSDQYKEKSMSLLESVAAEKNNIINKWKTLNTKPSNAADSQALLHLKKHYCDHFQCLSCSIGHSILKN